MICEVCARRLKRHSCVACGADLPRGARSDRRYCSYRCRMRVAKRRERAKDLETEDAFPE
jgi:predicted nucleic acid-binding Zn ribbon protein